MTREMKNSGVEWIGDIPSEWKLEKNKHCFELTKNIVGGNFLSYELLSLTKKGIVIKDVNNSFGKVPESYETYQSVKKGQLVLCLFDLDCSAVFSGLSNHNGMISPAYKVYDCKNNIDKKYAAYWFDYCFDGRKYKIYSKSLRYVVNADDFGDIEIILPPLSEQKRIADFLDIKVTEIDKIISDTKASIENYKEYKQSVITEAVTKGLDKNVPMKDSGIEWIGEIPVDWRLGKIKSCVTKVGSGKTPKGGGDVYSSEGVLFLRSQNVYDTGLVLDDPTYISEEIDEEMKNTRVMDKDVLLNITGGSIGRCCIYDKSYGKANVNQHVSIIRLKQDIMFPEYMHYYWLSSLGKMSVNLYQTGGNREGMSADAIKNSPIIYTSISTQKEIIAFLDSKCAEIDNIILEKEKLITNLEEYKKSLIYEYVTGKKVVE